MTSNHHLAAKPFRIGLPGLPGRTNGRRVDPYADRAIARIGEVLGEIRWLTPRDAQNAYKKINNEAQWVERHVLAWLRDPFRPPLAKKRATGLDDLLAVLGHTELLDGVERRVTAQNPSLNASALLSNKNIFHFLFAVAYYRIGFRDADGIAGWMLDEDDGGAKGAYQLVTLEALNAYVQENKLEVDDAQGNRADFDAAAAEEVGDTTVGFELRAFEAYLKRFVEDFAYRREPLDIIRKASEDLGLNATDEEIDYLAHYFENSSIELTDQRAQNLIPSVLTQYRSTTSGSLISPSAASGPLDFRVEYHTATDDASAVTPENVRCAAQLFYVMTLGDELGVFRASDLLVTRKLSVGQVDVKSPQLLRDLQDYAFNDEFRDVSSSRMHQRTSPEERQMFYRQVFDLGDTQLLDGMVTNSDFTHLWSALMVETVRYIEKVERSDEPESNVSRNAVAQVIDDLRYNLSTYCSGMAKVMTPIAYRELDFLIQRIWKSQEIIDQLALHNTGSFWRAIERCLQEDTGHSIGLTALLKKAEYGHQILSSVADFSPQTVLDDERWTSLVSTIEAFIITSEQVDADHGPPELLGSGAPSAGAPGMNGMNGMNGAAPLDEWAF